MTHEAATTVKELPETLPAGETILRQCAPNWRSLYRRAFHGRTLAIYFAILIVLRGCNSLWSGGTAVDALIAMAWLVPAAVFALGVLALLAWLTARATWYTITDKRIVMRIGIVLEVTFNFPFEVIDSVGLHLYPNGTGDLPLRFMEGEQIAYAHLWPHVRPWRLRRTEPMLRCVDDATGLAELLASVMQERSAGSLSAIVVPHRTAGQTRAPSSVNMAAGLG
jgi:hypothetical protein